MHWMFVALAVVGACKKDKTQPPPSPAAPSSTADQDALWALAPDGAVGGIVATPAALAKIERGITSVEKLFAAAPDLAPFRAKMEQAIEDGLGTKVMSLAAVGLTARKGFAAFAVGEDVVLVVPVGDRDKFVSLLKGTKGADGVDTFPKATCKTVKNVYACVKDPALFDRIGKGNVADKLKLVAARGDIELAFTSPVEPKLTAAAVVQIGAGSFTVRAAVKDFPPRAKAFLANAKPRVDGDKTAGFSVATFRQVIDALAAQVPPAPIGEGVTLDALVKSLDGPLTMTVENGSMLFDVRVPLNDGGPAQKLVSQCDKFPPLAQMGATVKDGVCHVAVPQMQIALDAWVDGKTLHVGQKGAASTNQTSPLSPVGRELATGEWTFAMFGRGTLFAPVSMTLPAPPDALPAEALLGIRALSMLNEVGIGVKLDGEVIRTLVTVRTLWANPDDVVAKLVAVNPRDVMAGKAASQGKAIADANPKSPFAADYKTGMAGLMMPVAMIGAVSAVAVPAFLDYTKKSKVGEAQLQLNKLAKSLEVAYVTDATYPKGKVGPSPAKPCCGSSPNNKCVPDATTWSDPVWQALDFQILEPHVYRYAYESVDGTSYVVTASGDLDCDGQEATWTLKGRANNGNPTQEIIPPPPGEY